MSIDEVDTLMNDFDKWDAKHAKDAFIKRMEHKLHRKERRDRIGR